MVDNGSRDGSPEVVRHLFPWVKLITNPDNYGFAHAVNQGLRASSGRFCLLLNSDTEVQKDALVKMVDFMTSHPEVGVLGPQILNPDGSIQPSCRSFPSLWTQLWETTGLSRCFPRSRLFGSYRMGYWDHRHLGEVDQVMGASLMVRREVMEEVGLLDENYFFCFEEVDWCYRIKNRGWKIYFYPYAKVFHRGGGTSRQNLPRSLLFRYQGLFYFFRKHRGPFQTFLLTILVFLEVVFKFLLLATTSQGEDKLRGYRDVLVWIFFKGKFKGSLRRPLPDRGTQ